MNHNGKLRSKRGLLPFVELNGEEIADSEIIMKALAKQLDKDMDQGMGGDQMGVQHAMVAMVDNHLNWWVQNNDTLTKVEKCITMSSIHIFSHQKQQNFPKMYLKEVDNFGANCQQI